MANIEKFTITSPPNTLFQGISTNYQDNLTYVEYLLGVLKKMNAVIEQVNSNTSFIENYDGRITELETEITALRKEIEDFEAKVESDFDKLETELINTINAKLVEIRTELIGLLAVYRAESKAYTDTRIAQVEEEIDQILIGQITLRDPTTGLVSPLQTVIDNLYDTTREEALTATEYDALDLTATAYDGYNISAFNYDYYGKTILTA
jgi:predicted RNase H-like nuclease (RuvC/YqgF family)